MSEKRYSFNVNKMSIEKDGKFFAYTTVEHNKIVNELNALHEENTELLNFKEKVFNSIEGKIKNGDETVEWCKNIDADAGAMEFHIEMLKILKKELFENDGYN